MTNDNSTAEADQAVEVPTEIRTYHADTVQRLLEWVADGADDVKDGVDEQAVYLQDRSPSLRPWGNDGCFTTGEAKAYLGLMMDRKKALVRVLTKGDLVVGGVYGLRRPLVVNNSGAVYWNADVTRVRVTSLEEDRRYVRAERLDGGGSDGMDSVSQVINPECLVLVTDQVQPDPDPDLARQVETLTAELAQVKANWTADLMQVGTEFWREAAARSWCSEANEVIRRINRDIVGHLPDQDEVEVEREFEVTWIDRYSVDVRRYATVTAANPDDAVEIAQAEAGALSIYDIYNTGEASVDLQDTDDWEAEAQ